MGDPIGGEFSSKDSVTSGISSLLKAMVAFPQLNLARSLQSGL